MAGHLGLWPFVNSFDMHIYIVRPKFDWSIDMKWPLICTAYQWSWKCVHIAWWFYAGPNGL